MSVLFLPKIKGNELMNYASVPPQCTDGANGLFHLICSLYMKIDQVCATLRKILHITSGLSINRCTFPVSIISEPG